MKPEFEKYMEYVEEFDLTEDQKHELIQTLWNIIESFVDRAFEVDSTQSALQAAFHESGKISSRKSKNQIDSRLQQPKTQTRGHRHDFS